MKRFILLTLAIGVLLTSCSEKQSKNDYLQTKSGLKYKFYKQNQGDTPQLMDYLEVYLSCHVNDTAVIIPNNFMMMQMSDPLFAGDIFEGIKMMSKGDSASFIVRIDSTFYTLFQRPVMPPMFKMDDVMKFEIGLKDFYSSTEYLNKRVTEIKEMFPDETAKAEEELNQYFKENNITATATPYGLYYVKTKEGNGEKPAKGKMVSVHYTGTLLDGTVFDSSIERNEPIQFILGIGQVIPGWDEGIQMMSKGEQGVLYIPYYLAYGDRGAGSIPPFATLKFEVELIEF